MNEGHEQFCASDEWRAELSGGVFVAADSMASDGLREFHHDDVYQPLDPAGLSDRLRAAGFVDIDVSVYLDQGWNASARKPMSDPAT